MTLFSRGIRLAVLLVPPAALLLVLAVLPACSVVQTRPVQEMSDTQAALRAAKEVQADVLAPELYRQAADWFLQARNEYRQKNFSEAREFLEKSRRYAEQAEFEAVLGGAQRNDLSPPPPPEKTADNYDYPEPAGTPAAAYEEQQRRQAAEAAAPSDKPAPAPNGGGR